MTRLIAQLIHVSKYFDSHPLFEDISLSINEGESFALIGENGSGKTTLLKLIEGSIKPDAGQVERASHLTLGYLPQEVVLAQDATVQEYLEEGILKELERKMAECLKNPERLQEWGKLHEEYEMRGGYRQIPLEKVLKGLKLEANLHQSMRMLSSGQRVRVALAKVLMHDPELILLDEPTNHLDAEMIRWLQQMLRERKGASIIVSHDRKFLNESCNLLIDIHKGKLTRYGGNYDYYLEEHQRLIARQIQAFEEQEEEKKAIKQKIKALTFSKAKASPPSDRNIMAYDRRGEHHQKSVERVLNELKERLLYIEEHPLTHPKPKTVTGLQFVSTPLNSKVALEFSHVTKSFNGKVLFTDFNHTLSKGERIVLMGPNGAGKTTLLRLAYGLLKPDSGNILRSSTAKIAFMDQEVEMLPLDKTPLEYFEHKFSLNEEGLRRELHKAALGGAELLHKPLKKLSVGQRKRILLLSLILEKPNVILLDEPTNHLDLLTLEAFEKALLKFEGAILAVSHDPTFISKVSTDVWRL